MQSLCKVELKYCIFELYSLLGPLEDETIHVQLVQQRACVTYISQLEKKLYHVHRYHYKFICLYYLNIII